MHIFWNVVRTNTPPQKVVCRRCVFAVGRALAGRTNLTTLAVSEEASKLASDNAVILEAVVIPNTYKTAASLMLGGAIAIIDSEIDTPLVVNAFGRSPYNYSVKLISNLYGPSVLNRIVANKDDLKNLSLEQ